jgi:hypothetical protein
VILDWITPRGDSLIPPLARNVKFDRGFHHEWTGSLLCPTNLDGSDNEYILSLNVPFCADIIQSQGKTKVRRVDNDGR